MMLTGKLTPLIGKENDRHVSALLIKGGLKRPYKDDLKPFNDIFTPKNLTLTLLKAVLVPITNVANEFNMHTIAAERSEEEDVEEFDWNESIDRNQKLILPNLFRVSSITIIKKGLDEYVSHNLSDKLADKLTKDVGKSTLRKCARYNRMEACQKIMYTAFWGNALYNVSCFTFDVMLHISNEVWECVNGAKAAKPVLDRLMNNAKFVVKRAVFYTVCCGCGAVGQAVGTYFSVDYGGTLGAFVFELAGGISCSMLLGC
jgi:hypothetical protein